MAFWTWTEKEVRRVLRLAHPRKSWRRWSKYASGTVAAAVAIARADGPARAVERKGACSMEAIACPCIEVLLGSELPTVATALAALVAAP